MAAPKSKKSDIHPEQILGLAIRYSPIIVPILVLGIFASAIGWPLLSKDLKLTREVAEKQNYITTAAASNANITKVTQELEVFKKKVVEFENRLPRRLKTTLMIETIKEITQKSKLKFNSIDPLTIKKYTLEETKDNFVELPVRVKLNSGYYDLVDFLQKIETASQLMKIADLTIRDDPSSDWEHLIEFSISAFSKGDVSD